MTFKATLKPVDRIRPGLWFIYRPMAYLDSMKLERECKTPEDRLAFIASRIMESSVGKITGENLGAMNLTLTSDIVGIVMGTHQADELQVFRKN